MNVHHQWVQILHSRLDATDMTRHVTCSIVTLTNAFFHFEAQLFTTLLESFSYFFRSLVVNRYEYHDIFTNNQFLQVFVEVEVSETYWHLFGAWYVHGFISEQGKAWCIINFLNNFPDDNVGTYLNNFILNIWTHVLGIFWMIENVFLQTYIPGFDSKSQKSSEFSIIQLWSYQRQRSTVVITSQRQFLLSTKNDGFYYWPWRWERQRLLTLRRLCPSRTHGRKWNPSESGYYSARPLCLQKSVAWENPLEL